MMFGDEEEIRPGRAVPVPAPEIVSRSPSRSCRKPVLHAPVFHPLAYRGVVAEWPVEWRERWGRRANALEENGLSWRDAEAQAFVEVWSQLRRQPAAHPPTPTLASSDAERN